MPTGRPKRAEIALTPEARVQLEELAHSRWLPHGVVRRARIILASAAGDSNTAIARRWGLSLPTISLWRDRYLTQGLTGLYGEARPGRPRGHDDERVAALLAKTLRARPPQATHWSVRRVAKETGIPKSTVQRYLNLCGVQPHRQRSFKLSTDPFFVEKVREGVGLYLNPPENALVLCVDEKSQIQALERTQPMLPMGLGYVEGVTHDYRRHGTTTLFAALTVANGEVLTQCQARHRHQEFLAFLRHVDRNVPAALDVHLILDNYATHKHPQVRAWLAAHPRYHLHYTPTYASWLNQVERWFGLLTQQAIRRGSFRTVRELIRQIDTFVRHYTEHPRPFAWTATAESILSKLERRCPVISGTRH